jgi:hypothetical protein
VRLWELTPGAWFCISSQPKNKDGWHDEWFAPHELCEVDGYVRDIAQGHVYFAPTAFKVRRRTRATTEPPALLFADLDANYDRGRLRELRPALLWETSPRKRSAVWVTDEIQDDDHRNHQLTDYLHADAGGWAWSKVLRFPGSTNWKYADAPRGHVIECNFNRVTCTAGFDQLLPQIERYGGKGRVVPAVDPNLHDWRDVLRRYRCGRLFEYVNAYTGHEKRSQVYWRIACDLIEAGALRDEVACVVWASWAFQQKNGENLLVLAKEIHRAFEKKGNV